GLPWLHRPEYLFVWDVPRLVKKRWTATTFGFGHQRAPVPTASIGGTVPGCIRHETHWELDGEGKGWLQPSAYVAYAARSLREGRAGLGEVFHSLCARLSRSRLFGHPEGGIRRRFLCSLGRGVLGWPRSPRRDALWGFNWRRHFPHRGRTAECTRGSRHRH